MNTNIQTAPSIPTRILYTMVRVRDLDTSIAFYQNAFGMYELRRETFTDARFTLVFMGYGDAEMQPTIELTWNWDTQNYDHGSGYGHIALGVEDIYAACDHLGKMGIAITRAPGPMMNAPDETGHKEVIAFLKDPDGYNIELIEVPKGNVAS